MREAYGADWWKKDQKARRARRQTGFAASPKKKKAWNEGWPTIMGWMEPYSGQDHVSYDAVDRYGDLQMDLYVQKEGSKYAVSLVETSHHDDQHAYQKEVSGLTKKQAVETLKRLAAETLEEWDQP